MTEPEMIWLLWQLLPEHDSVPDVLITAVQDYMGTEAMTAPNYRTAYDLMEEHWLQRRSI